MAASTHNFLFFLKPIIQGSATLAEPSGYENLVNWNIQSQYQLVQTIQT